MNAHHQRPSTVRTGQPLIDGPNRKGDVIGAVFEAFWTPSLQPLTPFELGDGMQRFGHVNSGFFRTDFAAVQSLDVPRKSLLFLGHRGGKGLRAFDVDDEVDHRKKEQQTHEPTCNAAPKHGIITWGEPRLFPLVNEGIGWTEGVGSCIGFLAPKMRRGGCSVLKSHLEVMRTPSDLQSDFELIADRSSDVRCQHLTGVLVNVPELEFKAGDITLQHELDEVNGFTPTVDNHAVGVGRVMDGQGKLAGTRRCQVDNGP